MLAPSSAPIPKTIQGVGGGVSPVTSMYVHGASGKQGKSSLMSVEL